MEKGTVIFFIFGIIPVTGVDPIMPIYKVPKMVVHFEQTTQDAKNAKDILNTFSDNMKLDESERRLLLTYSDCTTGFRPSKKLLADKSGLIDRTITNARDRLSKRNIIFVDSDHIYLRWSDYKSVCLADPFMMNDGLKGKPSLMPFYESVRFEYMEKEELSEYFYNTKKLVETLKNVNAKAAETLCRKLVNYKKELEKDDWEEADYKSIVDDDCFGDFDMPENPFKNIPEEQFEGDGLPF